MNKMIAILVLGLSLFSLRRLPAEELETQPTEEAKRQIDAVAAPTEAAAVEFKPIFDQLHTLLDDAPKGKPIEAPKVSTKTPPE